MTEPTTSNSDDSSTKARIQLSIGGMTCSSCSGTVQSALSNAPNVVDSAVDLLGSKAWVDVVHSSNDDSATTIDSIGSSLVETIESIGFTASVLLVTKVTKSEPTQKTILQFRLDGLTCAACVHTVEGAVSGLGFEDDDFKVRLFPEPSLEIKTSSGEKMSSSIIEAIEDVGFGATLVSSRNVTQTSSAARTVQLTVPSAFLQTSLQFLEKQKGNVTDIAILEQKQKGESAPISSTTNDLETGTTNSISKARIRITIEDGRVRPLLRTLQTATSCSTIEVSEVAPQQDADERRLLELRRYHRDFVYSACLAIPIGIISMGLAMIPSVHFIDEIAFWNMTWEEVLTWILATPVQFGSGARFYRESYYSLRTGHWGMGLLICVGTSAAYLYSVFAILLNAVQNVESRLSNAFETSALLIMFVLLGKYLEHKAKGRTSKAIGDLVKLSAESANLVGTWSDDEGRVKDCAEETIPIVLVQPDDILIVRPGEKVPSDGIIITGTTSIDESMLTGESVPASKFKDDTVIGGTINLDGSIRIRVSLVGGDTTLAQIIRLVDEAQSSRAPIQDFADYISARFVPTVMITSLLTYVIWTALLQSSALDSIKENWNYTDHGLNDWTLPLIFSISVLVISCPCAVGLATPTAIMVGTGVGAKHGILIKGGEPLEAASRIAAVVFDKTGTLTFGRPTVADVLLLSDRCASMFETAVTSGESTPFEDIADDLKECAGLKDDTGTSLVRAKTLENIFFLAASAEYGSEHPLAKGILAKAATLGIGDGLLRSPVRPDDFASETGKGISCTVEGHAIHIGNRRCLQSNDISLREGTHDAMEHLEKQGQTAVVVSVDGKTEAVIGLIDKAKDEAALAVNVLHKWMEVDVYMLTGDNALTARVVGASIGLDPQFVVADVLPDGKVDCIKRLQAKYKGAVAMIGDGVNDSPALAQADIGMAVGAGTNIAMETAGIVLVNSKLTDVVTATHLAKTIYNRIRWNFVWALGYNTLAIPLGAGVFYPLMNRVLPPFVAGIAMILSSMTVLLSSLLLNQYKPPLYEKEYQRNESGDVGLRSVRVSTYDGSTKNIQCNCSVSGFCGCDPGTCQCVGCELHKGTVPEMALQNAFPGCTSAWGNGCSCKGVCRCGNGCCGEKQDFSRVAI